jgi:uncharacterized protein (DUF3820 family)
MELTFGKFKGHEIEDVPTSYLAFLLDAQFVDDEVKGECLDILNFRYSEYELKSKPFNQSMIDKVYKKLIIRHHPDKGGNHYAMIALNEFRELLIQEL